VLRPDWATDGLERNETNASNNRRSKEQGMMHDEEVIDDLLDKIEALKAERDALRTALEVVLNDLMYKDHSKVIDFARAALKAREVKP